MQYDPQDWSRDGRACSADRDRDPCGVGQSCGNALSLRYAENHEIDQVSDSDNNDEEEDNDNNNNDNDNNDEEEDNNNNDDNDNNDNNNSDDAAAADDNSGDDDDNNDDDDDDNNNNIIVIVIIIIIIIIIIIVVVVVIIIIINHIERRKSRFLQSPHCAANCLQHARSNGPGAVVCKSRATHRALMTCNKCATWYEGKAQLLSLPEFK